MKFDWFEFALDLLFAAVLTFLVCGVWISLPPSDRQLIQFFNRVFF